MNSKSDAELVSLAQEGSQPALQELFERHYTRIFGICRRMLRSEDDACDATQEVFLSIVRHLKNFSGEATFKTWAYRIAVNACKDELSKRKTRPVLSPEDDLLEPESTGAAAGDVAHIVVDVQAALAQLGEEYRTAIVLREQAELSYEEIARMLEVPVGTVRSRIARGRAELTRLLKLGESDTEVLGAGLSESSETSSTQRPPIPERKLPSFFEDEDALGTPGARGFGRSTIFSRSRTKDAGTARPSKSGGRKPSQAAFIGLAALLLVGFLTYSLVLLFNENGDGDDTEAAADVLEAQVADLEPDTDALEEQTSAFLTDSTTSTAIVPEMTTPEPAPTLPAATLPAAAETTQPAPPGDARAETPQDKLPDLDLAPIPSAPEEESSQGTDGSPTFGLPEPPPIQLPATPSPDEPIVAPSPEGMLDAFDRSACPDTETDGPATTTTTTLDDTPSTTIPADEGEKRLEDEEPSASEEAPKSETSDQDESCP